MSGLQGIFADNWLNQSVSQALFDDVYVIFPVHVNFRITSRFVLKATIHKNKNSELFYVTWESFFSKKRSWVIYGAFVTTKSRVRFLNGYITLG